MPIYEYECSGCHFRFDRRQRFDEKPTATCPTCRGEARRIIRAVPIVFKGSGFYSTDHGRSNFNGSPSSPLKSESQKAETHAEQVVSGEKKEGAPIEKI